MFFILIFGPGLFGGKFELITICTKCSPPAKSMNYTDSTKGVKNLCFDDYKELCTLITSINKM